MASQMFTISFNCARGEGGSRKARQSVEGGARATLAAANLYEAWASHERWPMNSKAGRTIVALCALSALAGLVTYAFLGSSRVTAQALPDAGKFKVGSALGEERAGFSGRAKVQVFTSSADPNWSA